MHDAIRERSVRNRGRPTLACAISGFPKYLVQAHANWYPQILYSPASRYCR